MAHSELLVTDLDGTLLGDDDAVKRFIEWWQRHGTGMKLVYASGRFCDSVAESISVLNLPIPDAVIGGVGTEIRLYPYGIRSVEWEQRWWLFWDVDRVRRVLSEFADLILQPAEFQSELKTSYFVYDATTDLLRAIQRALAEHRISADLVYSSNRDLDIVPQGANKGTAAMFLARLWNIPKNAVIVAGDSGNDFSLFVQNFRGIVVSNAQSELKALNSPIVYHARAPYASGLLDGLQFWLGSSR